MLMKALSRCVSVWYLSLSLIISNTFQFADTCDTTKEKNDNLDCFLDKTNVWEKVQTLVFFQNFQEFLLGRWRSQILRNSLSGCD